MEKNELQKLERRAKRLVKKQGSYLLAYDVVGSRKVGAKIGYAKMYDYLVGWNALVNRRFRTCLTEGQISVERIFRNFGPILGDSGGGFFLDIKAIGQIAALAEKSLPFRLRFAVGADGWDKRIKELCA